MAVDQDNLARYKPLADAAAAANGIPAQIFENLVGLETGGAWDPYAVGTSGEIGLTQLMPNVVANYGINAYDPGQNLQTGAAYLKQIYLALGSGATWAQALSAYNSGNPNSAVGGAYAAQVLAGVTSAGNVIGSPVNVSAADAPKPDSGFTGALHAFLNIFINDAAGNPDVGTATPTEKPTLNSLIANLITPGGTVKPATVTAATAPATFAKYAIAFLVIGTTVIIGFKMLATPALRAGASFIPGR